MHGCDGFGPVVGFHGSIHGYSFIQDVLGRFHEEHVVRAILSVASLRQAVSVGLKQFEEAAADANLAVVTVKRRKKQRRKVENYDSRTALRLHYLV